MTTKKTAPKKGDARAQPADPRAPLPPTDANVASTLHEVKAVLKHVPAPKEPGRGDLVNALIHIVLAEGLPCGIGQESVRRIELAFVDRNEFRVTEAYEVAELLEDLQIPNLFARCVIVRDSIAQIYNDQNGVSLEFLREAGVSDRQTFFNRVPAIPPKIAKYFSHLLSFEEAIFAEKPPPRVLQRLSIEGSGEKLCTELREMLKAFGHLPFKVSADSTSESLSSKPHLMPVLSPACLVMRLAPHGKR